MRLRVAVFLRKTHNAISNLGAKQSTRCGDPARGTACCYMQIEQLLCWSGMTDTEHKTSGSNEKEERAIKLERG